MAFDTYIRFALALVLVVGLIALVAWFARRFGIVGKLSPGSGTPSSHKRLSVVEACSVDARRRLVLVRRDDQEHLILLTGNGSGVVVERGIGKTPDKRNFRDLAESAAADLDEWDDDDEAAAQDEAETTVPRTPTKGRN
ncbi:MAG: hypothetical protein HOK61_01925 [Alphaproteobacteria bacterium]|jgi:flagellar protein FliO/FliZ|nr:hypothetical protein [Alphaproteobacteria bacterium]